MGSWTGARVSARLASTNISNPASFGLPKQKKEFQECVENINTLIRAAVSMETRETVATNILADVQRMLWRDLICDFVQII